MHPAIIARERVGRCDQPEEANAWSERARRVKPGLICGICREHGRDPDSIVPCHALGLDYVPCAPFRVPSARLAAARHWFFNNLFPGSSNAA